MDMMDTLGLVAPGALTGAGAAAQERLRALAEQARTCSRQIHGAGEQAAGATRIEWESETAQLFRTGMSRHGSQVVLARDQLEQAAVELELAGEQIRAHLEGLATAMAAARDRLGQALHRETQRLLDGVQDLAGDTVEAGRRALESVEVCGARAAAEALGGDPLAAGVRSALAQAGVR
ncbi:hypothetical protein LBW78_02900 [Rothia kristinae]|uniref:hypothetical protein n=1 Tax=Rothia kristinae TaxID=37923 RepID=UPI001CD1F62D|nr:hypothetical protein [Rothia kristinae]MCA1169350.1 hypothetical protein [Rothia kristinae]